MAGRLAPPHAAARAPAREAPACIDKAAIASLAAAPAVLAAQLIRAYSITIHYISRCAFFSY